MLYEVITQVEEDGADRPHEDHPTGDMRKTGGGGHHDPELIKNRSHGDLSSAEPEPALRKRRRLP